MYKTPCLNRDLTGFDGLPECRNRDGIKGIQGLPGIGHVLKALKGRNMLAQGDEPPNSIPRRHSTTPRDVFVVRRGALGLRRLFEVGKDRLRINIKKNKGDRGDARS